MDNKSIAIFSTLLAFISVLFPINVPAQNLPSLPTSESIRTGKLSNGASYYIVKNDSKAGMADIALVQRVGTESEGSRYAGESVVQAMGALSELPHFTSFSPFYFMNMSGIFPGPKGYVSVGKDATIYDFKDIVVAGKSDAVDSTLLMIFDIIGRRSGPLDDLYSPQNQAIVISGDIDPDNIVGRMYVLSLLVTKKSASLPEKEYSWRPSDHRGFVIDSVKGGNAVLSARYISPRTPKENIATVQTLVSQRYASELGGILEKRLIRSFRQSGTPLGGVECRYVGSQNSAGDESFTVSLTVDRKDLVMAAGLLSSELASLDENGTSTGEYTDAMNHLFTASKVSVSSGGISNSDYVSACIANFLYGASLASRKDEVKFFTSKNIDDERGTKLFNNYISALLDKDRNLTLICKAEPSDGLRDSVEATFDSFWIPNSRIYVDNDDTTSFRRSGSKQKIKLETDEPITGGKVWTFANGIRVVYKKMSTDGILYYCWLLKGGSSSIPGLKPGEAPFLGDMFWLRGVSGMTGQDFRNMLSANGILMNAEVSMSDLRIEGAAPSSKFDLLMKSFMAMANEGTSVSQAWPYYKECETMRLSDEDGMEQRKALLDSILAPTFGFWSHRNADALDEGLPALADRYYRTEFSKMNDGVLILVGDYDELTMKKALSQYIGGFQTDKVVTYRAKIEYDPVKIKTIRYRDGNFPSVDIALRAEMNFTAEGFMASYIAGAVVTQELRRTAAKMGWTCLAESHLVMFPAEEFNVKVYMNPAAREGLPASMVMSLHSEELVTRIRFALEDLSARGVSEAELSAYKGILGSYYESVTADPQQIINMLLLRYSYGKDMVANNSSKLKAVTKESVDAVITALCKGGIAESVVRAKENVTVHSDNPEILNYPEVPPVTFTAAADTTGISQMGLDIANEINVNK